jgi:hypothetical protein
MAAAHLHPLCRNAPQGLATLKMFKLAPAVRNRVHESASDVSRRQPPQYLAAKKKNNLGLDVQ